MSHVKPWQICAVAAFTLVALVSAVPTASAGTGDEYANQTPYGNPKDSVRKAPAGYSMFFIETVARHGSRSLVDDGPEKDVLRVWNEAEKKKALTATGTGLARDIKRFQDAERKIGGYGLLSGLGRKEMHGIGWRTAGNYASFFSAVRKKSETIATVTTDVTRTKQSASSLRDGLADKVVGSLDKVLAKPAESNKLLRIHNDASSTGEAMIEKVRDRKSVRDHAKHLLSASYKRSFVDSIDDPVEAALDVYKLFITAPGMRTDTDITFERYVPKDDRETLGYATEVKMFYQYGPGVKGETKSFSKARPLLKDFFERLDRRVGGGSTAAVFRVAHGETTVPFAALIKAPGSQAQMPKGEPFSRDKNRWRGAVAARLAGNIEWVAYRNKDRQVLVTMRYNEEPVRFHSGCSPYKKDSYFYRVSALKDCLG